MTFPRWSMARIASLAERTRSACRRSGGTASVLAPEGKSVGRSCSIDSPSLLRQRELGVRCAALDGFEVRVIAPYDSNCGHCEARTSSRVTALAGCPDEGQDVAGQEGAT